MRSSLSLKVMLVIGYAEGGPRPRQLCLLPAPKVRTSLGVFSVCLCDERIEVMREPKTGVSHCLTMEKTIGRLAVMTATKVSLTAHEPASCAPFWGS